MSIADFNGTSNAAEHIGDKAAKNLAKALSAGTEPLQLSLSLGAEAANIIRLSIQVKDREGRDLAEVVRLNLRLYAATMIEALAAAATLSEVASNGSAVTTDAQAGLVLDTESDGSAQVDIEDVSTALVGDLNLLIEPLEREGKLQFLAVTFA